MVPKNEHIGQALRVSTPLFPELSIRELVANALIHQDMIITGAGPLIELFEGRLEISNPGQPLVEIDRIIDAPPRSRNEALAALMRRMGICEEQGSGMDKVFMQVETFQLPAPLIETVANTTKVTLYAPRNFSEMTSDERVRACYHHAVLQQISGQRMKNKSLCKRLGIELHNAAQATKIINTAKSKELIIFADEEHPRGGYKPFWA